MFFYQKHDECDLAKRLERACSEYERHHAEARFVYIAQLLTFHFKRSPITLTSAAIDYFLVVWPILQSSFSFDTFPLSSPKLGMP